MKLEITKKSDLALRALRFLQREEGSTVKGADLAAALGTTATYVPQVMQPLVRSGWVMSDPGPSGGYRIAVTLDEVSVLDLVEAVEGSTDRQTCVLRGSACSSVDPCAIHAPWTKARDALLEELASTSIADASSA